MRQTVTQRNRMEMCLDVLLTCKVQKRVTKIMYGSNINCSILKNEILPLLVKKGLLKEYPIKASRTVKAGRLLSNNPKIVAYSYEVTSKGFTFVEKYQELRRLWDYEMSILKC